MTVSVPDVARGYAVWLEPAHLHFHSGGKAEVRAYWGSMMQRDGQGQSENWRAYVIDPAGTEIPASIEIGEVLFHTVAFQANAEGLYTVVLENNAGIYCTLPDGSWVRDGGPVLPQGARCSRYVQWARVAAPVGHHVHGTPPGTISGGLDIIPGSHHDFAPGDRLGLRVYFRGKPLPGAVLKGTSHLFNGSEYPLTGVAGQEGEAEFTFSAKGHWMFTVTYTDDKDAKEGLYHSTVHTTTLVVPGVR
ncbi:MAG: hypothetical protein VR69_09415 [Peptococcaceae bacterium BRH_c4b]|nr:MAG: hypothetical protein VR69_09415 [Peptococcaceae bacterium BRH_c4b]